jgi:membrane protein
MRYMTSLTGMRGQIQPLFKEIVDVTGSAFQAFGRRRTGRMAAALAYYTFFSLFPLLLLLLSGLGFLLDAGWPVATEASDYLVALTEESLPAFGDLVSGTIASIQAARGTSGLIGLLGLLWSASAAINQIQIALDQIWGFETSAFPRKVRRRAESILVVLGFGLLLVAAQALKSITHWIAQFSDQIPGGGLAYQVLTWVFPFVTAVLVFGVMFRTFPSRSMSWQDVFPGAVLSGIGWELLKWLFVFYAAQFANWQAVYGPVASVIGLLTWLYLSFTVILFGAEFAAALGSARAVRNGDLDSEPVSEFDKEPIQLSASPVLAEDDVDEPVPIEPLPPDSRRRNFLSGTATGVIGAVAAVVIGIGVLVGGVRRWGRTSSDH